VSGVQFSEVAFKKGYPNRIPLFKCGVSLRETPAIVFQAKVQAKVFLTISP